MVLDLNTNLSVSEAQVLINYSANAVQQKYNANRMYNFKFSSSHIKKVRKETKEINLNHFNFNEISYLVQYI